MSALAACAILAQLVLAPSGYVGTLSVGDRSEARVRSVINSSNAVDLETSPYATLAFNGRRSDFALSYVPRFSLFDVTHDPSFAVFNAGRTAFGWAATERLRLEIAGEGAIGSQLAAQSLRSPQAAAPTGTTATAAPPATGATFAPPVSVINTLSYRAQTSANYRFSRRTSGDVTVAYGGGRGLDAPSRAIIAPYYGPSGGAGVSYTVTREDTLATRARAAYTYGPVLGSEYLDVTPTETWTHQFSLRTSGLVGAGVAYLRYRTARTLPRSSGFYPFGEGALTHAVPLGPDEILALRASTRLSVQYDPVLQASRPQLAASVSSAWTSVHYGATAIVEAITTFKTDAAPRTARQLSGGVVLFHAPSKVVRFEAGARGYIQDAPLVPGPTGTTPTAVAQSDTLQWAAFAALVLTAPPAEL